jgi:hypothetical protein
MKTSAFLPSLAGVLILHLAAPIARSEEKPDPTAAPANSPTKAPAVPADTKSTPAPARRNLLKYTPPKSAGPAGPRVDGDGGSRGDKEKLPSIYVLAPKQIALTTQAQPALFWYQTEASAAGFELTVTEPKKAEPLLSLKGEDKQAGGTHSVSLAKHKVTLAPNVSYQWSVALVPDAKNRSKDLVASGYVKRVEAPADLAAKIDNASAADRAAIYAQAGYWYDALQSISIAIGEATKNKDAAAVADLRKLRASLLDQGDLKQAAAADRK